VTRRAPRGARSSRLLAVGIIVFALAVLATLVFFFADGSTRTTVQQYLQRVGHQPFAWLWITAIYVIAGFVLVPVSLLIAATLVACGVTRGVPYALLGAVISAVVTFGIGRALGELTARRLFNARYETVRRRLENCNLMAVALLRLLPIAPYSIVNFVAGAIGVPFRAYVGGTLLGLTPGVIAIALITSDLAGNGTATAIPIAVGVIILVVLTVAARGRRAGGALWSAAASRRIR
jgi:phospholipase D1/2